MNKRVIGLLGGMGSGKSAVAAEFARHGGQIIVGDVLGHEALRQPDIREQVVRHFGADILADGAIDRRKLGAKVFADIAQRQALEALVHPWITRRIREEMRAADSDLAVRFIVLDAAVMLEAGWNNVCDWLVYIDVPREQRLERVSRQRGWSEKEVTAREAAQMPLNEKKTKADVVLDNSGSLEDTAQQVADLLRKLELIQSHERRI